MGKTGQPREGLEPPWDGLAIADARSAAGCDPAPRDPLAPAQRLAAGLDLGPAPAVASALGTAAGVATGDETAGEETAPGVAADQGTAAASTPAPPSPGQLARSVVQAVGAIVALPLRALVFVYRVFISPVLPPACRYYPSCSRYAAEALRVHGPLRGSWLAIWRLLRCHPFCEGGVDLVPPPAGAPPRPLTSRPQL